MAQHQAVSEAKERTVVLGVRMGVELRTGIRVEAASRGMTIAELFEEMWIGYLERRDVQQR